MAKGSGGGGRAGRGGGGGVNFSTMTPEQVVTRARSTVVTSVGQLSKQQIQALRGAVRRGELMNYPSFWGDGRAFGPVPPGMR